MEVEDLLPQVRIVKKADDPEGILRISIGSVPAVPPYPEGTYLVYRGTKEQAIAGLQRALEALKTAAEYLGPGKEPAVQPDDGKRYA